MELFDLLTAVSKQAVSNVGAKWACRRWQIAHGSCWWKLNQSISPVEAFQLRLCSPAHGLKLHGANTRWSYDPLLTEIEVSLLSLHFCWNFFQRWQKWLWIGTRRYLQKWLHQLNFNASDYHLAWCTIDFHLSWRDAIKRRRHLRIQVFHEIQKSKS